MTTAIIYARVSTPGQAEEELSLPSQIEQCEKKAQALGATVVRRFVDEGISAASDRRPAFQDAIAFAEIEQPTYLITWNTSRFARNRIDAPLYKARLDHAGVSLVYASVEIDRKSDAGWLLEGIYEVFDEHQSRAIAADTKRSMMKNAKSGFFNGGRTPFGYQLVPATLDSRRKMLAPHEEESATVLEIFRRRAAGEDALPIAVAMNQAGSTNRLLPWRKRSILELLRNESVIGRVIFNRMDKRRTNRRVRPREDWIVVDSHQAIVPMDLWDAVQKTMPAAGEGYRDGSGLNQWIFTGLLRCGECGAHLNIETATGRNKSYSYYDCRSWMQLRECKSLRLRADVLESWLIEMMLERVFSFENLEHLIQDLNKSAGKHATEATRKKRELMARISKIETRNRRLYEILELHGRGAPNLGDLTERLRANNAEAKGCQAELAALDRLQLETPPLDRAQVEQVRAVLAESVRTTQNYSKLRRLVKTFVETVTVKDGNVLVQYDPRALVAPAVHSAGVWLPGRDGLSTVPVSGSLKQILHLILPPAAIAAGNRGRRRGQAAA